MECIELMIVVAIIGILAAIAIPAYSNYTIKAATTACKGEAKGYTNSVIIALSEAQPVPALPTGGACANYTDTVTTSLAALVVKAAAKAPSTAIISCNGAGTCTASTD